MNSPQATNTKRRILLAVDACTHGMASLETTVALAARLNAELVGLFVEDINMLRLAALPFSREWSAGGTGSRPMAEPDMARMLRAQAGQMQQRLADVASQQHVSWSFSVTRGAVAAQVMQAAQEVDLVAMELANWDHTSQARLELSTLTVMQSSACPVLLLPAGVQWHAPVVCVYTGTAVAQRALMLAREIGATNGGLTVLLASNNQTQLAQWRQEINRLLAGQKVTFVQCLPRYSHVIAVMRSMAAGTIVLPDDAVMQADADIHTQFAKRQFAVLVAR